MGKGQLASGYRSRAVRISPPLPGDQTNILMNPPFQRHTEEMIRRIVREEIQVREELGKMSNHNLTPRLLPDPNIPAQYQLQFMNKVKNPTFTTDLVKDENGDPIKVAIYDMHTQSIISPDNFLSSAKATITALDAELWKNKGVNWSRSEFVQNELSEREGKGPILIGRSLTIQLENGVGTFKNIVFNDNSSWTKSGFRLGVMVEVHGEEGYLNGERVQEGVSEPFRVKDRRVKESKKPDLLKLTHGVKSIKKIGQGRASLLLKKNINTVEDFLKLYYKDETALREILCIKSESGKGWMSMVEHATQCADEFHAKCIALNNSSQPRQPMEKNSSVCTKVERCVASWGSSRPNPSGKDKIEAGMPISTAYGEHIMEMQNPLAGFPHDESELLLDTFYDNLDSIMDGSGGGGGNY